MFYLETKDGEKFFTDPKSDDKVEFEKILEQKLGESAAELFNQIIQDHQEAKDEFIERLSYDLNDLIVDLDKCETVTDIIPCLAELRRICNRLE